MTTSKRSTENSIEESRCLQADLLASPQVVPGTSKAKQMTAGSGQTLSALLRKPGRLNSCLKILLESSTWASTESLLTWRGSATKSGRSIYRLVPSTPRNSDTDSGSSVSNWATPRASDFNKGVRTPEGYAKELERKSNGHDLPTQLTTWGTPRASRGGYQVDKNGNKCPTLEGHLASWPTPQARDVKGQTQNADRMDAVPNILKATWPTPNASDGSAGPNPKKPGQTGQGLPAAFGKTPSGFLARTESFVERLTTLSAWLMGYTVPYCKL